MSEIRIIQTEDGSHSLYRPDLNETYHSFHGAIQESNYVFIKMGLQHWLDVTSPTKPINILEIGFGTGLNALLTYNFCNQNKIPINYESLETIPVSHDVYNQLNYTDRIGYNEVFQKMHDCPWNQQNKMSDLFNLSKHKTGLETFESETLFDIIFFDAFAPSKQPELWEKPMISKCFDLMSLGGVFVTYCAKGQLKRDIQSVGMALETLPGAPGKKEMVRGTKPTL